MNRDEISLVDDGQWHLLECFPQDDPLTSFAGATADGVILDDWGTAEYIRLFNTDDGQTRYRVCIDDIVNTDFDDIPIELTGFEPHIINTEVVFQEPVFSGSTENFLVDGVYNSALVTNEQAHTGLQSNQIEFEFVDDTEGNWVRLTSFQTQTLPNPLMYVGPASIVSFYAKMEVILDDPGLACDVTDDSTVDAADAGAMFANWGNPGTGDCNDDELVDAADAGIMFSEWTGDSGAGLSQVSPLQLVPEHMSPISALACCAVLGVGFVRQRSAPPD